MKPYYEENGITIFCRDCMEAMKEMPDKAFELAIVDPPYGIGDFTQSDATEFKSVKWNDSIPDENYFTDGDTTSTQQHFTPYKETLNDNQTT